MAYQRRILPTSSMRSYQASKPFC